MSEGLEFAYGLAHNFYHLTLPDPSGYFRIQKYSEDLSELLLDLYTDISGIEQTVPLGLGVTSTRYYVANAGSRLYEGGMVPISEIRIYLDDGTLYGYFGLTETQGLWGAGEIIFTLDEAGDRVYIYHRSEKKLYSTNLNGSNAVSPVLSGVSVADVSDLVDCMRFYEGNLYIFDYYNKMVYVHDAADGSRVSSFSMAEEGDGDFDYVGMTVANDKIFISRDHEYEPPYEIKVFDLEGNFLGCIEMASELGPGYLEVNSIYVYNFSNSIAEAYDILGFGGGIF